MAQHRSHHAGFQHLLHLGIDKDLVEVGLFKFFITLGKSLIMLSLVFYLYNDLKYEVWQVFGFYFAWCVPFSIIGPFVGFFFKWLRLKLKYAMATQTIGESLFWIMLPSLVTGDFQNDIIRILPFFFIRALSLELSQTAYDVFLSNHAKKHKGEILAWIQIGIVLASILAPIIGALTTVWWGIEYTSYVAVAAFAIGGGILFLTPDKKFNINYTVKTMFRDSLKPSIRPLLIGCWGYYGYDCILWLVWPMFLILIFGDLISLSVIIGGSSALAMIMAFVSGKLIDKNKDGADDVLRGGVARAVVINALRPFGGSAIMLAGIDALNKINDQSVYAAFHAKLYGWLHQKPKKAFERAHIRWMACETSYTIPSALLTLLFYFSQEKWTFVLVFALGALNLCCVGAMTKLKY